MSPPPDGAEGSGPADTPRRRAGARVLARRHALNLHSRLAQRVLVQLSLPTAVSRISTSSASAVAWEIWFTRADLQDRSHGAAQPAESLNFAALKIKDAVADRFRQKTGRAPRRDTQWPDVRIYAHLTTDTATLYIDTSGEPLFKRGWREDKGEAPLKETLAAAMIAASGWERTPTACRCTTPAAAAAPLPSRPRRSPAASRPARGGASASRNCCPSRPMSGRR
jgi:23S rRNA G2445 N2-methylase RlmL